MAAQRFGGKYSPGSRPEAGAPPAKAGPAPKVAPFRGRRARQVSLRARLMFLLPLPLLFAGIGAIGRGDATEMVAEVGGFAALMLGAWLLNEGLRAQAAYDARKVAKPPAIPRKLFAAALASLAVFGVGWLSMGQSMAGALIFGLVAGGAHVAAFGLDPMRKKGIEGIDAFATERVARAIDKAEALVRASLDAAARIGDRPLEARIERLCDQAREVFRAVEEDPRDLGRARTFLTVYLMGLRDATAKFAGIYSRSRDQTARRKYEALLGDLETSFAAHRTTLLIEDRGALDVEIEVLRDRLRQDGLTTQ